MNNKPTFDSLIEAVQAVPGCHFRPYCYGIAAVMLGQEVAGHVVDPDRVIYLKRLGAAFIYWFLPIQLRREPAATFSARVSFKGVAKYIDRNSQAQINRYFSPGKQIHIDDRGRTWKKVQVVHPKTITHERRDAEAWYRWHDWTNGDQRPPGNGISHWVRALIRDTHSPMSPVCENWDVVY